MDIRLPDRSGFDVTHILKSEDVTHAIPVVVTSAYGADVDKAVLRECGCGRYIPAPIRISSFVDVIHGLVGACPFGSDQNT
jgi:two-component system cell cycle response regulator DivK